MQFKPIKLYQYSTMLKEIKALVLVIAILMVGYAQAKEANKGNSNDRQKVVEGINEVIYALEIPYTLEEFFVVRQDLINFGQKYGLEPRYRKSFFSDSRKVLTRDLWLLTEVWDGITPIPPPTALFIDYNNYDNYDTYDNEGDNNYSNVLVFRLLRKHGFEKDKLKILIDDFTYQFASRYQKEAKDVTADLPH